MPNNCCKNKNFEEVSSNKSLQTLQAIKPSIFCSFKGTIIFGIGVIHIFYGIGVRPFHKYTSDRKIKEGYATVKRNFIPFLEMLATTMFLRYMRPKGIKKIFTCAALCWISMILVCHFLRANKFIDRCCNDFNTKNTFNSKGEFISLCLKSDSVLDPRKIWERSINDIVNRGKDDFCETVDDTLNYANDDTSLISNKTTKVIERAIYALPFQALLICKVLEKITHSIIDKFITPVSLVQNKTPVMELCLDMATCGLYSFKNQR